MKMQCTVVSPVHQVPNQPTKQPQSSGLTFRFRGYHCNCLFCLLSQSQVSKSSSTSPRKLLRLNVSRCHTDRFSFCVFKISFSILYCSSKKEIKVNNIILCQSYNNIEMKRKVICVDQIFSSVRFQVSRILHSHLILSVFFQRAKIHLSQKLIFFAPLEKANHGSNIIAGNSFLKTKANYSFFLLDVFSSKQV